jgi:riboflavin transporter FmnP
MIKKNNRPFLTGGAIKCIGLGLMVMDHLHQMFMAQGAPDWLGWFGRPVAAMFLFLCAEAFYHTRSKKRYMLQLLAGFIFMTALNMILSRLMPLETVVLTNNIFGTLFMAA